MNLCESMILPFIQRVNDPRVSLVLLPHLRRFLGRNGQELRRLVSNSAWEARWVATQKVTEAFEPQETWKLLCELAQDPVRNVREGAAHAFGALLEHAPDLLETYKNTITDAKTSEKLRKAVLLSTVVLWQKSPEHLDIAVSLLTTAASQPPEGCLRNIGAQLINNELMKVHPQMAKQLLSCWERSDNINLQYHAARGGKTISSMQRTI